MQINQIQTFIANSILKETLYHEQQLIPKQLSQSLYFVSLSFHWSVKIPCIHVKPSPNNFTDQWLNIGGSHLSIEVKDHYVQTVISKKQ
jgi:hypothetical protein